MEKHFQKNKLCCIKMIWKSAFVFLSIFSAVSNAQSTNVEEIPIEVDKQNNLINNIVEPSDNSIDTNFKKPLYSQNYRPNNKPAMVYPTYTPSRRNMGPIMSPYPYSPQPVQWQQLPMNYWPAPALQQPNLNTYEPSSPTYQEAPMQLYYNPEMPTPSVYTDPNNGFYPGSPNWRKSFTPSANGCFNRCRPSCGNVGYGYGCRPTCRSSCNIRPTCGSSAPSYYGNTMVCGRNNYGYPNFAYRGSSPNMAPTSMNKENPASPNAFNSGSFE